MGRAHSLSGAGIWLGGTAAYSYATGFQMDPAILVMGTVITAGAALGPDLDSYTATVTKSFGIFGRIFYYIANTISILMYNLTRTRKDDDITNGHRTFFHTLAASLMMGAITLGLTSLPGTLPFFGDTLTTGQFSALIIMAFFLHLGIAGLFAPQIKKAKKSFGPYLIMAVSLAVTFGVSKFLPTGKEDSYHWLAAVVAAGWFIHILGDTITKMGTPFAWPLKIRGKRWYDISLPSMFRITAGGSVELVILTPIFIILIVGGAIINGLIISGVLPTAVGA